MYVNKCIKCGKEFETKNPKRVICPACLYADRAAETEATSASQSDETSAYPKNYSFGGRQGGDAPRRNNYNNNRPPQRNNFGNTRQGNTFRHTNNNQGGGFRRPNNNQGNNRFQNRRPQGRKPAAPKAMLLEKEQLAQIEALYKKMLPLPNHDAHEVIAQQLEIEPKKVFFGINLIRQKMMLPKIPYPKRKLALTPDQLTAIKNLYEPLLPTPPIGCHKILAAQLKMDEWRVHVGIGLVRKQMGLERWNPDRPDAPEEYRKKD